MIETIITSSILIVVVLALRFALRSKLSPVVIYALWAIVALRLLIPVSFFDSHMSVMNLFEREETVDIEQTVQSVPEDRLEAFSFDADSDGQADEIPYTEYELIQHEQSDSTVQSHNGVNVKAILLSVWLIGAAAVAGYVLSANIHFYRLLNTTRRPMNDITAPISVYEAEHISSPCIFGLLRPAIYLTEYAADDRERAGYVITHELMHYRHLDHIWSVVRNVCCVVYWFNPLVWLAAYLSRQDSELACDSAVIKAVGDKYRIDYGRTLVDMVSVGISPADLVLTSTTMSSGGRSIKERITMIKKNPKTLVWAAIAVAAVIVAAFIITFTGAVSDAASDSSNPFSSAADANSTGSLASDECPDLLAQYTTMFNAANTGRSSNIKTSARYIDGTVLKPGEVFSFNSVVGERTEERGFVKATGYAFEETAEDYAAGISQTATTLYNAAFESGLQITEQRNHMYTVNYTTDSDGTPCLGNDATVAWDMPDLKFVNNKDHPVMIRMTCSDDEITAEIHGTDDGIRVEFVFSEFATYPYSTVFMPPTENSVNQSGQHGRTVIVSRIVSENGSELFREEAYTAYYMPMTEIIYTEELPVGCEYNKEYSYNELKTNENGEIYYPGAMDISSVWSEPDYQYLLKDVPMFENAELIECAYYPKGIEIFNPGKYNLQGITPEIDWLVMVFGDADYKDRYEYVESLRDAGFTYCADDGSGEDLDLCVLYNAPNDGVGVQIEAGGDEAILVFFRQENGCLGYGEPIPRG